MKKRVYKLIKRSFLVFLALVTFLLVLTPMPVLPSEVPIGRDVTNYPNRIMNEDFDLFCLAALSDRSDANGSQMNYEDRGN